MKPNPQEAISRRRAGFLPDGGYVFEDEITISGVVTLPIITGVTWLLELYTIREGSILFHSGTETISPPSRFFGVLYPPFSITLPRFCELRASVVGFAATASLPKQFLTNPIVFEVQKFEKQLNLDKLIRMLQASNSRNSVAMNPKPSLLTLRTKRIIDKTFHSQPAINRIARHLGVTPEHLCRQFKRDFNLTPTTYLHKLRVADAPLHLARGENIANVSFEVGYNDLSRFYKQFRKVTGSSPGACRKTLKKLISTRTEP